ncbi:MAG: SLC13 family permease, partial [Pseudomonadota bacterium]
MLVVLLNIVPQNIALSGFGSDIFFLVFGVFILSTLLSESAWFDRVEAILNRRQASFRTGIWAILGAGVLLTLMVPSPLGRASMLQPMVSRLWRRGGRRRNSVLAAAHIHSVTLLSTLVLTGNPLNFVLIGLLEEQSRGRFGWLGWLFATWFAGVFLCAILVVVFAFAARAADAADGDGDRTELAKEEKPLRAIGLQDWATLGLYGVLFAAILGRDLHQIPLQWVVMLLGVGVFFFSGISLTSLRRQFDWPTLVFIATVVAWGPMLDHLGLSERLAESVSFLEGVFEESFYHGIFVMIAVVLAVRLVVPGAPAFILLASTLMPVGENIGVSAWVMGFIIITISEAFIWPYQHGVSSQTLSELETERVDYSAGLLLLSNLFFLAMRCIAIVLCASWWAQINLI